MTTRLRVLVVEDRAIMASAFALLLEQWGHEVRIAYDGRMGLSMARSYLPDAVLVDLDLTHFDAQLVARRLRELPGLEQVLLIGISHSPFFAGRPKQGDEVFAHHLANPFDPALLQDLLRRWIWRTRPTIVPPTELVPAPLGTNAFSAAAPFFSA